MGKTIQKITKGAVWGVGGAITAAVAVVVGWIIYSRKYIQHAMKLERALDADLNDYESPESGLVRYYVDIPNQQKKAVPLVLLHSINAAPSAYEMKPLFEHFLGERPVYALDLPGFGFSARSNQVYSPKLYERVITSFLKDIVGEPADVVALSLSCEFASHAATQNAEFFHSLVMISPTGFGLPKVENISERVEKRGGRNLFYSGLAVSFWNRPIYDLVSSRPSIQFFLNKSFEGLVPDSFVDYAYQTAHQPGAQFAPTYFLSGKLFTPAVRESIYQQINLPVLVLYDRDPYTNFEMLPLLLRDNENWKGVRISPTKGLPHWEQSDRCAREMKAFWSEI